MGVVYEAWQVALGRRVALKVLSHALADERHQLRFEREAWAAARLHHTNIVPVFSVGQHEGTPYYVMQFIQGVGLDVVLDEGRRPFTRLDATEPQSGSPAPEAPTPPPGESRPDPDRPRPPLARARPLPGLGLEPPALIDGADDPGRWKWAARLGVQAADGLHYAHSQGILHRDVKPSNLILDERGTLWVTDFGLAKWVGQEDFTRSGDLVGTLRYIPPEAFDGAVDARADVYGLGLTLYELLAGRPAFDEPDRARLTRQVAEAAPPRLRKLDPAIPLDLATVVEKAIEKDPEGRYATAAELGADLQRFLDDVPVLARRASAAERCWRWSRRNPELAILGGALATVLLLATLGSLLAARSFRDQADRARRLAAESESRRIDALIARGEEEAASRVAVNALAERDRVLYVTRSNLAAAALELDDYGQFRTQLDQMRPSPGEPDLRGWEWRYLLGLDRRERLAIRKPGERFVAVAARPDGSGFATLALDGAIRAWDLRDGRPAGTIAEAAAGRRPADLREGVQALAFDPDGGRVAGAGPGPLGTVGIYDARTGELLRALELDHKAVLSMAWTPDGKTLAAACSDHLVRLWDAESGRPKGDLPGGHKGPIAAVAVGPEGRFAATSGLDGVVKLWSLGPEPSHVRDLLGHEGELRAAAFSPDGASLATGGLDGSVRIWDVATGAAKMVIQAHKGGVLCLAYDPDGRWLASGGRDDAVRLWEPESGRRLRKFLGHTQGVRAMAASPDGRSLISLSTEGVVKVWDPQAPARPRPLRDDSLRMIGGSAGCLALSPDGRLLASGHDDHAIRIWDAATGRVLRRLTGHDSRVRSLSFSPDGRLLASSSGDPDRPPESRGAAIIWDVATGRRLRSYEGHRDVVDAVLFLGSGTRIASAGGDHDVHLWDAATGERTGLLKGHADSVRRLAVARDGRTLASGSGDSTIRLWDLRTGKSRAELDAGGEVLALAFDARGEALAASSRGGPLRVWRVEDFSVSKVLDGHLGEVAALAYTPDGRLASGGADKAVRVWDAGSALAVLSLKEHGAAVTALAASADGSILASAGLDRTIFLWEAPPAD